MANKVLKSSLFSSGAQVINKSLGLVSTLILARMLAPEDFALIAVISIVLYFFDILSNSGSEQYIIQKSVLKNSDLHTAWTLDLFIKGAMFTCLLILAPYITGFLEKPEITNGLRVASLLLLINALKQPRLILLKRQLNYQLLFRLSFIQKIISFVVVICGAYSLQNFWAFVIADLVGAIFLLLASYVILPKRPKLSLTNIKLQWLFSKWLLGKNILGYLRSQIDTLFVSKFFNNNLLGNYHMAREVAMLPGHHFLAPAIEPLLASFKSVKHDLSALALQFNKALLVLSLAATPICVFLIFYGDIVIKVLLGEQWQSAEQLLTIFSLLFIYWVYLLLIEAALTALAKVRLLFWIDLLSLMVTFLTLGLAMAFNQDIALIAMVRVTTGAILTLIIILLTSTLIKVNFFRVSRTVIWPTLPAVFIAYLLNFLDLSNFSTLTALFLYGSLYCGLVSASYVGILLITKKSIDHQFVLGLLKL